MYPRRYRNTSERSIRIHFWWF